MASPFERLTRDLERQLAQFRALAQPPWMRMVNELSQAHLTTVDLASKIQRQFGHLDALTAQIQGDFGQLDALASDIQRQFRHLDALAKPVLPDLTHVLPTIDIARSSSFPLAPELVRTLDLAWELRLFRPSAELQRINEFSMAAALPVLRSLDEAIAHALSSPERLGLGFQSSFAAQLLQHLTEIDARAEDERAMAEELTDLVATFLDKCKTLARDPTHAWGMFQTLLTLVLFLLAMLSDKATENRLSGQITQVEQRSTAAIQDAVRQMRTAVESLHPAESNAVEYVVLREVKLTIRPTKKSSIIRTLYPNEIAVLLDAKGTWIKVKIFDYVNGTSNTGWVLKKYLKRLEVSPQTRQHLTP